MITEMGKQMRMLRIERDEKLLDMAGKLGMSPSFLSAVEKGHKAPPAGMEENVIAAYGLNWTEAAKLRSAADRSRHAFTIKPETELGRDTVGMLARRMNDIPDVDLAAIQSILNKSEKK